MSETSGGSLDRTEPLLKTLLIALALGVCIFSCNQVEAATISVDAELSHPDLSVTNPIEFAVRFPTAFLAIELLTIDAYWVGDGLDAGEIIAYTPDLAGVGVFPGGATQFFRRLTFPAYLGFDLSPFLDGGFDGTIYADRDQFCDEIGLPCTANTTVMFGRLVFTLDGEPTPVPEPATGALVIMAIPPILLRSRAWVRGHRRRLLEPNPRPSGRMTRFGKPADPQERLVQ
jgi:hypothetical protein